MLIKEQKISFLEEYLSLKNNNYGDIIKDELNFYFFENQHNLNFLNSLNTRDEIENKIDSLVSKIIMHEHEDGINEIIEYYL